MLPESQAPPLANYEEFKAFMAERGIRVIRDYVWPEPPRRSSTEYTDEDPQWGGDFWQIIISKDWPLEDGRIYTQMTFMDEHTVLTGWRQAWEIEADLLEKAGQYGMEDKGLA